MSAMVLLLASGVEQWTLTTHTHPDSSSAPMSDTIVRVGVLETFRMPSGVASRAILPVPVLEGGDRRTLAHTLVFPRAVFTGRSCFEVANRGDF